VSTLEIECRFHSSELQGLPIPVEIRRQDLTVLARTVAPASVSVAPGTYVVSARLPAGLEMHALVSVGPHDSRRTVVLEPSPSEQSPHESEEVQRFVRGALSVAAKDGVSQRAGFAQELALQKARGCVVRLSQGWAVRGFRGNLLAGPPQEVFTPLLTRQQKALPAGCLEFEICPEVSMVQVLQPDIPPLNIMVPASRNEPGGRQVQPQPATIVFQQADEGRFLVTVHPRDVIADALLQYAKEGYSAELSNLVGERFDANTAEKLLEEKTGAPITAAVAAYLLLRLGDIDRLHDWTRNLCDWFPWLADGVAICGEHLARRGRHREAFEVFLRLSQRGLPICSAGLAFVIDRLRRYLSLSAANFPPAKLEAARALVEQLQPYATYADNRLLLLAFTGLDPANPDDRSVARDSPWFASADVAIHLRSLAPHVPSVPPPPLSKVVGRPSMPRNLIGPHGRLFAELQPGTDATAFQVNNTSGDYYNSPYFMKHKADLQQVPPPRVSPPRMSLADVVGMDLIAAIQAAKKIAFHAVGDTGAAKVNVHQTAAQALAQEARVADAMAADVRAGGLNAPAFLFHLGDVVYHFGEGQSYYDQFYEPFRAYDRPIFAIPGNHDGMVYGDVPDRPKVKTLTAFLRNFCAVTPGASPDAGGLVRSAMTQPGVYFTLDAPFVSIIGLYSNVLDGPGVISSQGGRYPIGDEQLSFLKSELARLKPLRAAGERAVILAIHHPPVSADGKHGGTAGLANDIDASCRTAGLWPDAVLSGHAHLYQRFSRRVDGREIPYVVSSSGGFTATMPQGGATAGTTDGEYTLVKAPILDFGYLMVTVDSGTKTLTVAFRSPGRADEHDSVVVRL
jgi:hypothetical protein